MELGEAPFAVTLRQLPEETAPDHIVDAAVAADASDMGDRACFGFGLITVKGDSRSGEQVQAPRVSFLERAITNGMNAVRSPRKTSPKSIVASGQNKDSSSGQFIQSTA